MNTRNDIIDKLVNNEIDTIEQMIEQSDYTYLDSIIRNGIGGFDNLTNEKLEEEFYNTFEEKIKIV